MTDAPPRTVEVPAAVLVACGRLLNGIAWQGELARVLGIQRRILERWQSAAVRGEDVTLSTSLFDEIVGQVVAKLNTERTWTR